ncbi:MAG TPA: methyl-accepting chemotaxis protein [Thermodesulfovibrionales bacterium]|nr:methyl-accepting chemotaxis protein [Thermodesulfovibrionales bacterium]
MKHYFMNMSIARKFLVAPAAIMVFLILFGVISYRVFHSQQGELTDIYKNRFSTYQAAAQISKDLANVHANIYKIIGWIDARYAVEKVDALAKEQVAVMNQTTKAIQDKITSPKTLPEEKKIFEGLLSSLGEYKDSAQATIDLSGSVTEFATMYMQVADDKFLALNKELDSLVAYEKKLSEESYQRASSSFTKVMAAFLTGFILAVILSAAMTVFMKGLVVSPIKKLTEKLKEIAAGEGDLTKRVEISSKDEIGEMGKSLNLFLENIHGLVTTIRGTTLKTASATNQITTSSKQVMQGASTTAASAEQTLASMEEMAASIAQVAKNTESLATNVDETSATINEMAASIEQVGKNADVMAASVGETSATIEQMINSMEQSSKNTTSMTDSVNETSATVENLLSSVEQISKGTESLKHMVTESSGTIEEMMRTVQEVAGKIGEANRLSQAAYQDAEQGGKGIYQSIESLQNIGKTTEKTMGIIENLGKRSEEVGSIVEVINEIADQTNLLALNAAIEAARAGDAGRGFAVVADEIRKLAERSMEATKEIGAVIRQVQGETATAVKATEETYREGKGGMALASSSRDAFNSIIEAVKETSRIMEGIARSAGELSKATGQVMNYIVDMNSASGDVAAVVKIQADGTGSIRSTLEKMNSQVQEVNVATKEQAIGGNQIREALERMKTVVHEVNTAVKEQVRGARQIVESIEMMRGMTQDVAGAAAEQRVGGDTVVKAMEGMSHIASENLRLSTDMKGASEDTLSQVEYLQQSVSRFKIDSNGDKPEKKEVLAAA